MITDDTAVGLLRRVVGCLICLQQLQTLTLPSSSLPPWFSSPFPCRCSASCPLASSALNKRQPMKPLMSLCHWAPVRRSAIGSLTYIMRYLIWQRIGKGADARSADFPPSTAVSWDEGPKSKGSAGRLCKPGPAVADVPGKGGDSRLVFSKYLPQKLKFINNAASHMCIAKSFRRGTARSQSLQA